MRLKDKFGSVCNSSENRSLVDRKLEQNECGGDENYLVDE